MIISPMGTKKLPGIKIGDGSHKVTELPFIDKRMVAHMADTSIHYSITADEANHKLIFA